MPCSPEQSISPKSLRGAYWLPYQPAALRGLLMHYKCGVNGQLGMCLVSCLCLMFNLCRYILSPEACLSSCGEFKHAQSHQSLQLALHGVLFACHALFQASNYQTCLVKRKGRHSHIYMITSCQYLMLAMKKKLLLCLNIWRAPLLLKLPPAFDKPV